MTITDQQRQAHVERLRKALHTAQDALAALTGSPPQQQQPQQQPRQEHRPAAGPRPATDKQLGFLRSLAQDQSDAASDQSRAAAQDALAVEGLTSSEASQAIEAALQAKEQPF